MAMSEDIREDEDFENGASVEVEDDDSNDEYEVSSSDGDEEETRTNVRKKSEGDDELENYSESVQRRINQLTAKRKLRLKKLKRLFSMLKPFSKKRADEAAFAANERWFNSETENRLKAQEVQATRAYTEASEAGDYEKAAKAQQALSQIAVAKEKVRVQKIQLQRQQQAAQQAAQQQPQRQQQQQPVRQAPPQQRDPKLDSWLEKNSWFGSDRVMTRAAQAIHEELVLEQDFDPTSDDYYKEIDSRMRKEMPQKFNTGKRSNAQTVAPASSGRSVKSGRKKAVELSPGQVAFAKKMRIPLEKYAKEVAKINSRRT